MSRLIKARDSDVFSVRGKGLFEIEREREREREIVSFDRASDAMYVGYAKRGYDLSKGGFVRDAPPSPCSPGCAGKAWSSCAGGARHERHGWAPFGPGY